MDDFKNGVCFHFAVMCKASKYACQFVRGRISCIVDYHLCIEVWPLLNCCRGWIQHECYW